MTRYTSLVFISLAAALTIVVSPTSLGPSHAWSAPASGGKSKKSSSDLSEVLSAYEQVRALLAADKMDGLAAAARGLASAARKARQTDIEKAALPLAKAKDLASARKAFGKLSRPLVALVQADPALKKRLHVFECPMVTAGENQWIQPTAEIQNPYMGKSMPTCGTKK